MQVLCCGTRRWNDPVLIRQWLEQLPQRTPPITILVGDNREKLPKGIIGADFFITEIGFALGYNVLVFPALWQTFGRAAGPIRNKRMMDRHPDLVLAFRSDGESFGTDNVVDMAYKAEITVIMIKPDGSHQTLRKRDEAEQLVMFDVPKVEPNEELAQWMAEKNLGEV